TEQGSVRASPSLLRVPTLDLSPLMSCGTRAQLLWTARRRLAKRVATETGQRFRRITEEGRRRRQPCPPAAGDPHCRPAPVPGCSGCPVGGRPGLSAVLSRGG